MGADVLVNGIRTDSLSQLVPEKDRSRANLLTKSSVQSVTTITEAGFREQATSGPSFSRQDRQRCVQVIAVVRARRTH